jgi:hypothetical protein
MARERILLTIKPGLVLLYLAAGSGCESLYHAGVPGMERFVDIGARSRETEKYRDRYQQDRDANAMLWLLEHRIASGMSVADVNQIFGEDGERQYNRQRLTIGDGDYQTGDVIYKWGPDSKGNAAFLIFRDGHLVNYSPNEYARGGRVRAKVGLDDSGDDQ